MTTPKEEKEKLSRMEEALLVLMQALDKQIAREMQRSPEERESQGVQKWEPIDKRIERVCALVLDSFNSEQVELDSLLVLSQAFTKALSLYVGDMGSDGLGKVRSAYCERALAAIERDCQRSRMRLSSAPVLN